jgi:uncharacterized membrane protein
VIRRTFAGEIPWSESSTLISRVPMLLVPLTAIFFPTSWATVTIDEFAVVTSTRVSGRSMAASARTRKLAPAAARHSRAVKPGIRWGW